MSEETLRRLARAALSVAEDRSEQLEAAQTRIAALEDALLNLLNTRDTCDRGECRKTATHGYAGCSGGFCDDHAPAYMPDAPWGAEVRAAQELLATTAPRAQMYPDRCTAIDPGFGHRCELSVHDHGPEHSIYSGSWTW